MRRLFLISLFVFFIQIDVFGQEILVEVESFADKGGWKTDQQFTDIMGSPYLLAHGMGKPVHNAKTTIHFPEKGSYHVWVRTKDWVPGPWESPGRFQIIINGKILDTEFGTLPGWHWQIGGIVSINENKIEIELHDLTGFEGRCDALFFTKDSDFIPPDNINEMKVWRQTLHGIPEIPPDAGKFDVVIIGGGIAGCAAALAANEQGLKTALIHDRPVPGGNASSEVRVHTEGIHGKGGAILKKLDTVHYPNGSELAKIDDKKRQNAIDAAENVEQFLCWRAYAANTAGKRIISVDARHIENNKTLRFFAPVFIDCTGDGWIGYWAGAEYSYGRESFKKFDEKWDKYGDLWSPEKADQVTMGASLLWNSEKTDHPESFPEVPWAMPVAKDKKAINGEWYWEYADPEKHQIDDAEDIRDHMFRALYGSFFNAKQEKKNENVKLKWVGYILGKRESRRLVGDYIYTFKDAAEGKRFEDAVVTETRAIDVHYQLKLKSSRYNFLAEALYWDVEKYYIPFRSLYSKNIENLMMAGRCFSCSHIGLGGPRVMNTTGQMGIAVGFAASLCVKYDTIPRGVYKNHLKELLNLTGYGNEPE